MKTLKVLAVSDQEVPVIESPQLREQHGDVDVVLSCGDLPYTYLEYISTMLPVSCLYVHGNHDCDQLLSSGHFLRHPGGWHNIDGRTMLVHDWLIGGIEGSLRYRPGVPFQYTEVQIRRKITRMAVLLIINRIIHKRFIDILITHAPPSGIHDAQDLAHKGFESLLTFMQRYKPRYLIHGHQHRRNLDAWRTSYADTEVINIYPYRRLELEI